MTGGQTGQVGGYSSGVTGGQTTYVTGGQTTFVNGGQIGGYSSGVAGGQTREYVVKGGETTYVPQVTEKLYSANTGGNVVYTTGPVQSTAYEYVNAPGTYVEQAGQRWESSVP